MKITRITARPVRLPRDLSAATGTAGSPTALVEGAADYRWSSIYPCLYSRQFETALVLVETSAGFVGWGEAQAPLAPEVACTIVERLLAAVLVGEDFDGSRERIAELWDSMYSTMRVRGQTGGFMLDAISAIDIALWDIAGQLAGVPVAALLSRKPKQAIPAYLSGIPRGTTDTQGFRVVKLFYDTHTTEEFFEHVDSVIDAGGHVAVDALWRHTPESALAFGAHLEKREALWFEAPLPPEDALAHGTLARELRVPIAIGESYRTRFEMRPFFAAGAVGLYQPDIGRCGITEGVRLAAMAAEHGVQVVPHISIAFGPQLAAALHFAASVENCALAEYNPQVLTVANRFLVEPVRIEGTHYVTPHLPGLGIELRGV
jgi:galactonate dehydratase